MTAKFPRPPGHHTITPGMMIPNASRVIAFLEQAFGGECHERYEAPVAAGATAQTEPKNQFYGYRSATVTDPGGNRWTICAVIEKISTEEMKRRVAEAMNDPRPASGPS